MTMVDISKKDIILIALYYNPTWLLAIWVICETLAAEIVLFNNKKT